MVPPFNENPILYMYIHCICTCAYLHLGNAGAMCSICLLGILFPQFMKLFPRWWPTVISWYCSLQANLTFTWLWCGRARSHHEWLAGQVCELSRSCRWYALRGDLHQWAGTLKGQRGVLSGQGSHLCGDGARELRRKPRALGRPPCPQPAATLTHEHWRAAKRSVAEKQNLQGGNPSSKLIISPWTIDISWYITCKP